jgi:hypothetical protein
LAVVSCDIFPTVAVWLRKVDFEVDPNANNGNAFVCHIAVAYSKDLYDKLQGMDAKGYFSSVAALEKTYKDSIEIFKYDMIPGRNKLNQSISLSSYTRAKGAFLFAKYLTPGKFMENVGSARSLTVRFLPYKMETHSDISFDALRQKLNLE